MIGRSVYRSLGHGEPLPSGTPKRYRDADGYVILRWKVDRRTYVEAKEHRFLMGMPPAGMDVHHVNGIKDDNRIENLRVLPKQAHMSIHVRPSWNVDAAIADYQDGLSFPAIGRKYGTHHVSAMRAMKLRGLVARPSPKDKTHCDKGHELTPENTYRWVKKPNSRACRTCAREGQRKYARAKRLRHVATEKYIGVSTERGA